MADAPPPARIDTDVCVIGGGAAGLSVAAGASQMGARVVLVEKGEMGGDCLNFGCVPSKALLAAGHAAEAVRSAGRFGLRAGLTGIDGPGVRRHVTDTIAAIAPVDSQERFEGLGVTVLRAPARFTGPRSLRAGDTDIHARWVVLATGSAPAVPPIPGLGDVPYLTNETLFGLADLPGHLLVLGGGPIGIEMAQAHAALGCRVTVLEMGSILANDDPELADVVRRRLAAAGVTVMEGARAAQVAQTSQGIAVTVETPAGALTLEGSHLLVATGRRAAVAGLDLDKAGIAHTGKGITVDARLRTTNRKVFALGDAAGGPQFTHVAGYHAGVVLKNMLFRIPAKVDYRALPWVTYTDPELAQVGLTEARARTAGHKVNILRWSFHDNDRAQAEGRTEGHLKAVITPKGRVLGCGIVGPRAGDLIGLWALAISKGLGIGDIAQVVLPYPTFGEISKRAAGSYYTPRLFSDRTRAVVRFLMRFA